MIKKAVLLYIEASLCFMLTTPCLSLSNTNTYTTIITYTMPIFSSHAQPIGNNIFTALLSLLLSMKILFFLGLASSLPTPSPSHFSKFSNADIFSACKRTPHKAACESMLSSTLQRALPETLEELFDHSVKFSMDRAYLARALANNLTLNYEKSRSNDITSGMNDCLELLDDTLDQLTNVVSNNNNNQQTQTSTDDIQTWLSAAYTNQETCLESLKNDEVEKGLMDSTIQNLGQLIGNTLSLHVSSKTSSIRGGNRRLLYDDFPSWVSVSERKLFHASMGEIEVSAVVAKDGSGTHKTIGEALEASMEDGGRTVIHVRAGTYHENLKIPTKQKNVMLVGDGKGKTVIVGDRSNAGGWTTFQSATVAAMGDGFIARDITFVNNAGPAKQQAVALRVGSDKSVIFRCSIWGYQDSLYTHSKRQFYRENDIYGTVDFVFGNSAVVFQNCNMHVRKPLSGQNNFITAQGRTSPDQNTGISIHNCTIQAASDFAGEKSKFATYLGRPWKKYSRTVIMQSFLDDLIHPSGWSPWSGSFALKSLYYGEYKNSGPRSSTFSRVKWSGYHASLTSTEAQTFTVAGFIAGHLWLPSTGVPFDSGLLG